MLDMSNIVKRILLAILVVFLIYLVYVAVSFAIIANQIANPLPEEQLLRSSEKEIREFILEFTPIAMSCKDVESIIEDNEEWKIDYLSERGYAVSKGVAGIYTSYDYRVGEKSIRGIIGGYRSGIFSWTDVAVYWGFDENSELIDIAVTKYIDGP